MADERIVQRALTYEQDAALDGDVLTLRRMVNTREARAFDWIVEPDQAAQWSPYVPTERIAGTGPVGLRNDLDADPVTTEITQYQAPHKLAFSWQDEPIELSVAGTGLVPAMSPSCLLTVRHQLADPAQASEVATRWHLCISVLDLRIARMDVPRLVRADPEHPDFQRLRAAFDQALGTA